jgi:hypothetical protein
LRGKILYFLFKIFILLSILPPLAPLTNLSYVPEPNIHSFRYMALRIVGVSFGLVHGGSHSSFTQLQPRSGSHGTPLGIVTKLRPGRPSNRVSISDRTRDFFPPKVSTPALAPSRCVFSGYQALFPQRVKPPVRETDHPSPSNAKAKNEWSCVSTDPCAFMSCTETTLHFTNSAAA